MASAIAMMVGGALTNALAFSGSNFLFSQMSSAAERRRHNEAMEKLQRARDEWNEGRLERLDFINKKLKEQDHAQRTFNNVDQAMAQYYFLTGEKLDGIQAEPQLSDFLHEEDQKKIEAGELATVAVGLLITGYLTYKFI